MRSIHKVKSCGSHRETSCLELGPLASVICLSLDSCFLLLWTYTHFLSFLCSVAQVWNIQFLDSRLRKQKVLNIYQDHLFLLLFIYLFFAFIYLFFFFCIIFADEDWNTVWGGQRLLARMLSLQSEPTVFISAQLFNNWLWESQSGSLPHVVCMCWG